jgi:hypothetical protein
MAEDKVKLRDRAWPEVTNSEWGTERMAVRNFMKEEWKDRFEEEIEKIDTEDQLKSEEEAAEEEAGEILEV